MDSLLISLIAFACIFAGALFGMFLRARLPEHYLNDESKMLITLAMGLIITMTAILLGLMINTAMNSFNSQRNQLIQMEANIIFLDRILTFYGPEANDARQMLKSSVADLLQIINPSNSSLSAQIPHDMGGITPGEALYKRIEGMTPKNDAQRTLQTQALNTAFAIAQSRWLLFAQSTSSIPIPFIVIVTGWLTLIFVSFGLYTTSKINTVVIFLVCALTVSSALFLIMDLDQAYGGLIHLSIDPLRSAFQQLWN